MRVTAVPASVSGVNGAAPSGRIAESLGGGREETRRRILLGVSTNTEWAKARAFESLRPCAHGVARATMSACAMRLAAESVVALQ